MVARSRRNSPQARRTRAVADRAADVRKPVHDSISRVLSAAAFAAEKHRNQRRKDKEASPYINHPISVAQLLACKAEATHTSSSSLMPSTHGGRSGGT